MTDKKKLKAFIMVEFLANSNHRMSRTNLMKRLWPHYEHVQELDEALKQFQDASMVVFVHHLNTYVMPKAQVDEYNRLFQKK